ncbi:MAG: hypothetical protein GKR77_01625 [Legionellales bacterium]|nr:hypothetical protein [Legionellales bacterium]
MQRNESLSEKGLFDQIYEAALARDEKVLSELKERGVSMDISYNEETPVVKLAQESQLFAIDLLLNYGADVHSAIFYVAQQASATKVDTIINWVTEKITEDCKDDEDYAGRVDAGRGGFMLAPVSEATQEMITMLVTLTPSDSQNQRYMLFALAAKGEQRQLLTQLSIHLSLANIEAVLNGLKFDQCEKVLVSIVDRVKTLWNAQHDFNLDRMVELLKQMIEVDRSLKLRDWFASSSSSSPIDCINQLCKMATLDRIESSAFLEQLKNVDNIESLQWTWFFIQLISVNGFLDPDEVITDPNHASEAASSLNRPG